MIRRNKLALFLLLAFGAILLPATPGFLEDIRLQTPFPEISMHELLRYRDTEALSFADSLAASHQIVSICFAHGKHDLARHFLKRLPEFEEEPATANALITYSYIKDRQYLTARSAALRYPESQSAKAFSQLYMGDSMGAKASIQSSAHPELSAHLHIAERRAKKAWLAGTLAVVPGLGYAYNGMYQTALSAFLLNAALMATVWELQDRDLPIAASALGLAGSSFYLGSIWGSVHAAERINLRNRERHLDLLINPYIDDLLEQP